MIKLLKSSVLAVALITSLSANEKLSDKQINELENLKLFKMAKVKVKEGVDTGSLYMLNVTVRGKGDQIFLTKDKKYLIPGDVLSTKDGQPLTMPVDLKPTLGQEAFTYGTGKDEYVLFTDPECPYCKKFESFLPQIKDKVKIRVFYYPLRNHINAKDISLYIMSLKDNKAKIAAMETTKDTPAFKNRKIAEDKLTKLEKELNKQISIADSLGVTGTPTIFDKKGNKVQWPVMLQNYGVSLK